MKDFFSLIKLNKASRLLLMFITNLLYVVFLLVNPYCSQLLIDCVTAGNSAAAFRYMILLLALLALGQILGFASDLAKGSAEKYAWENICTQTRQCVLFHDPRKVTIRDADVHQYLGQSYEIIKNFISDYPVNIIVDAIEEISIIVILFRISPLNAGIVLLFVPFFVIVSNIYGERLAKTGEKTVSSMRNSRNYLSDLAVISLSERFRRHPRLQSFDNILSEYDASKIKQTHTEAVFSNFLSYAFLNLLIALSLIISSVMVLRGSMSVGSLFAVQLYVSRFWNPIESFVDCYKEYSAGKNIAADFLRFLHTECSAYESRPIQEIRLTEYQSTDGAGTMLHSPVSAVFCKGSISVIQGENGVGKTSLVLALMGFSDRFLGDISLPDFQHNSNFVYSMSTPLNSEWLSNSNAKKGLSAGQTKKLQLEDDFAEDKDVYIFDEPTNFLDDDARKVLRSRIDALRDNGKIVILITHDERFLRADDRIIRLEPVA